MTDTIPFDKNYSTTRMAIQADPAVIANEAKQSSSPEDKLEAVLFLPIGEGRKGEGGLRTKGYFKKSYEGKPLISIITVVYNGEKYLEETIQSVINQTYDNVEYIIIDGGSTDGTLDIIKKYEDRIDYWVSEKDSGIANAFNKGVISSTGNWLVMLNSGDWYIKNSILEDIVVKNLKSDSTFVYGDFEIVDPDTKKLIRKGSVLYDLKKIKFGLVLPHPSLFTSRNYFVKFGLFDESFRIAMDYEWMIRGIQKVKVLHIPELTTKITDGGISTQNQNAVIKEILKALKINKLCSKVCLLYVSIYFYSRLYAKNTLQWLNLYNRIKGFK